MRVLNTCGKIEVRESPIEGFGVFATENIPAGTLLEEVPFVLFPRYISLAKEIFNILKNNGWVAAKELYLDNLSSNLNFKLPDRYYFKWHPPVQIDGDSMFTVLPLGFGPIYNTSNTANNADWKMLRDTFTFKADKDIVKDEEIRTFYGYFLGEDGTTFNCEAVFHLAIDMFDSPKGKVHKVKLMRFGSLSTYEVQKNNPAAVKLNTLIFSSLDGLTLKRVSLIQSNGGVVFVFEVPENIGLTALYSKLAEIQSHPAPLVKFEVEYTKDNKKVTDEALWKK